MEEQLWAVLNAIINVMSLYFAHKKTITSKNLYYWSKNILYLRCFLRKWAYTVKEQYFIFHAK